MVSDGKVLEVELHAEEEEMKAKLARITVLVMVVYLLGSGQAKGIGNGYFYEDHIIGDGEYYNAAYAYNDAIVDMEGGLVVLNFELHESSTLNMHEGEIGQGILSLDNSRVSVWNGIVAMVQPEDNSVVSVYGGTVTDTVGVYDNARLNLYGGQFQNYVYSYIGSSSEIHVYGYGFGYDPLGGVLPPGFDSGGQLTGFWGNGTPFCITFRDFDYIGWHTYDEAVVLHEIPEPFALGILVVGVMVGKRRRPRVQQTCTPYGGGIG